MANIKLHVLKATRAERTVSLHFDSLEVLAEVVEQLRDEDFEVEVLWARTLFRSVDDAVGLAKDLTLNRNHE